MLPAKKDKKGLSLAWLRRVDSRGSGWGLGELASFMARLLMPPRS